MAHNQVIGSELRFDNHKRWSNPDHRNWKQVPVLRRGIGATVARLGTWGKLPIMML